MTAPHQDGGTSSIVVAEAETEALVTLDLIKDWIENGLRKLSSSFVAKVQANAERSRSLFCRGSHDDAWPEISVDPPLYYCSSLLLLLLATSLGQLYEVMDDAPEPTTPSSSSTSPPTKHKAAPPPGLLSLRHYTDICVLVEVMVCTMVLPLLPDSGVLVPMEERWRYHLPQAIAGRFSQERRDAVVALYTKQQQTTHDTQHAAQKLAHTVSILGRLLLLDRFRPMLWPRHRTDLFAALLWLEEQQTKGGDDTTASTNLAGLIHPPQLLHRLGFYYPTKDEHAQVAPRATIDAIGLAQTYQSLLRYGRQAPLWLRHAVGQRLQYLAQSVDLQAVILVFVAAAPEPSAAAQRLAVALQCHDDDDNRTVEQLVRLLDTIHATTMEQTHATAILHTVWAVLARHPGAIEQAVQILFRDTAVLLPRLATLWTTVPPRTYLGYRLLFSPLIQPGDLSLLGLLVRSLAATPSAPPTAVHVFQTIAAATAGADRDTWAVGVLQSVAPCPWDDHSTVVVVGGATLSVQRARIIRLPAEHHIHHAIEQRTKCVIGQHVVLPEHASALLRAVLVCFVSSPLPGWDDSMVPLVVLPTLCETVPMETLFLAEDDDEERNNGLWAVMSIVFAYMGGASNGTTTTTAALDPTLLQGFREYAKCIRPSPQDAVPSSAPSRRRNPTEETNKDERKAQVLGSIASVLLTLLVSILELGSSTRRSDEDKLRSLVQPLECVAKHPPMGAEELAEMASHAVALLQARSATVPPTVCSSSSFVAGQWEQAQRDLESSEPPLRARGVATLRNLANGLRPASETDQQPDDVTLLDILKLSIQALGDDESYVYLASIHTLVAVAATDPSTAMPLLSACFLTGTLVTEKERIVLSLDQRAKLTEALAFIVRRNIALGTELPRLLEQLCFGPRERTPLITVLDNHEKEIQAATHQYFVGDDQARCDEQQYWDDTQLRVRTGGPLFAEEEGDLVRSGRIVMASELVGVLPPAHLSPYVSLLMDCCIDALRIELSRPIRRAAASLALAIYSVIIEQEDVDADYVKAIVAGRHEVLVAVLGRCVAAEDLGDGSKAKLFDQATAARCQEALERVAQGSDALLIGEVAVEEERAGTPSSLFVLNSSTTATPQLPMIRVASESHENNDGGL